MYSKDTTVYSTLLAHCQVKSSWFNIFLLHRRKKQGFPLSLLLFALALGTEVIRSADDIFVFCKATCEDKLTLFEDNFFMFLGDTSVS